MKSEILRLLKESDDYISGQQMCDRFHVSRTAVWKAIEQLKKEGYEIEAVRIEGTAFSKVRILCRRRRFEAFGYRMGRKEYRLF